MRRKCLVDRPWLRAGQCWGRAALALGLLWFAPNAVHAQQPGQVVGHVLDAATGQPLEGAQITVGSAALGSLSGAQGDYQLMLPAGDHAITAARIGYRPRTLTVRAATGATVTANFELSTEADTPDPVLEPLPPGEWAPREDLPLPYPDSALLRHRQVLFRPFAPELGNTFDLPLFEDLVVRLRIDRRVEVGAARFDMVASLSMPGLPEGGTALLLLRDGQLTGSFHLGDRLLEIRPFQGDRHVVVELIPTGAGDSLFPPDPSPPAPIPVPRPPVPIPPGPPDTIRKAILDSLLMEPGIRPMPQAGTTAMCSDLVDPSAGPYPEVRLLVLVTDQAAAGGGDVVTELELRVLELNQAFEQSRMIPRIRLVGTRQVTVGDDGTVGGLEFLKRLIEPDDGHIDDVGVWRDRARADVVALYTWNVAGLGTAGTLQIVSPARADSAFVVINRQKAISDLGFHHEMGHVLGGQHERPNTEGLPYGYNFGHLISPTAVTIMAVPQTGTQKRVLRFSNPAVLYQGMPTGVVSSDPLAADNSRAITNTSGVTSGFRMTPVWFSSAAARAPWNERLATDQMVSDALFGDFDGDAETDALVVDEATGEWRWSRSASEEWRMRNGPDPELEIPVARMAVGDFNGDGRADVFWPDEAGGRWIWVSAATGSPATLRGPDSSLTHPLDDLAFGDFDGDSATDVFRSDSLTGAWSVSYGGTSSWAILSAADASRAVPTRELVVADFDGDGEADVLRAVPATNLWQYSASGTGVWSTLSSDKSEGTADVAFADFDGDGATDGFKTTGEAWMISSGAAGPWKEVFDSCHELPGLRFGDFDGDGTVDVIRAGIRP